MLAGPWLPKRFSLNLFIWIYSKEHKKEHSSQTPGSPAINYKNNYNETTHSTSRPWHNCFPPTPVSAASSFPASLSIPAWRCWLQVAQGLVLWEALSLLLLQSCWGSTDVRSGRSCWCDIQRIRWFPSTFRSPHGQSKREFMWDRVGQRDFKRSNPCRSSHSPVCPDTWLNNLFLKTSSDGVSTSSHTRNPGSHPWKMFSKVWPWSPLPLA